MVSMNCASMALPDRLRFGSTNRSALGSTLLSTARSLSTISSIPGRFTFTATFWPPTTARYTCPRDAPDMAFSSIVSKVSRMGPRSLSMMGRT